MKASRPLILCIRTISVLFLSVFFVQPAEAAAPVFRTVMSFTNSWWHPRGLNNAGDILAADLTSFNSSSGEVFAIVRGDTRLRITPVTDPLVKTAAAVAMSQRREDGHVFVAGKAVCTDGYSRACVWDVAPDGTFTFTVAQIIIPPSSEPIDSIAVAVNAQGVMVGEDTSPLALEPVRWTPPYNIAEQITLSSMGSSSLVDIDNNGNMLANGVEFGRGTSAHYLAAALVSATGTVTPIPWLDPGPVYVPPGPTPVPLPGQIPNYNGVSMRRGDWVVGNSGDAAFAWRVGTTNAIRMPGHAIPHSVNASGQALGYDYTVPTLTFWQYENSEFVATDLWRLIPADSFYPFVVEQSMLNDAGQVVVQYRDASKYPVETIMRVYEPVSDSIVSFSDPWTSGNEAKPIGAAGTNWTTGSMQFRLQLTRAGNDGPVTVYYRTVEGSAKAGLNYDPVESSVTWAAGDSVTKTVKVSLINNLEFDEGKSFELELTSAIGARLPEQRKLTGLLYDWEPSITAQNQVILTNGGWGVPVMQGASEVLVLLQRASGIDGKAIITNFIAMDDSARKGVDYLLPAGLSASWEAGQTGAVTISIPLLPTEPSATNRMFTLAADVLVEGSNYRGSAYFGVVIVSPEAGTFPLFYPYRSATLGRGRLRIPVTALKGAAIQLLSAPSLAGPWAVISEASSTNGVLTFAPPVSQTAGGEFFRLLQKP
jgi:hypothetical protein